MIDLEIEKKERVSRNTRAWYARQKAKYGDEFLQQRREYKRKYYVANRERLREKINKQREERREEIRLWDREYYAKTRERRREINRKCVNAHYLRNREILLQKGAEWREENRERFREMQRKWDKEHPENRLDRVHIRRARLLGTYAEPIDRSAIYIRDKGVCGICGGQVSQKEMSLDHIIPLAKGGIHSPLNVQLAHRGCNSKKGTKSMEEFLKIAI